jgi:hypothetical protein
MGNNRAKSELKTYVLLKYTTTNSISHKVPLDVYRVHGRYLEVSKIFLNFNC